MRYSNIFDIRFRNNGVSATGIMLVLVVGSSTLVAFNSKNLIYAENINKSLSTPSIPSKSNENLTEHFVIFKNVSTNINNTN